MKTLPSESREERGVRKVSKPQMEKRRRDRINDSLEKLRLLMVDNTQDENMKNPKVGKAEILESVVEFLKTEKDVGKGQRAVKKAQPTEQRPLRVAEDSYREGMKSCMLRVSQFIATKSQELMEAGGDAGQASPPEPKAHSSPPVSVRRALIPAAVGGCVAASPPGLISHDGIGHSYLTQVQRHHYDPHRMFSPTSAAPMPLSDPWRPWPQ
ncbi:hairy-related 5 [Antennarius striatus]|uniref:hairy-related 5 n=1 Tax=Antennarius striatus TaxID=241820 RepID=UPI0035B22719